MSKNGRVAQKTLFRGVKLEYDEGMRETWETIVSVFENPRAVGWMLFVVFLAAGWLVNRGLRGVFRRLRSAGKLPLQVLRLAEHAVRTVVWVIFLVQALHAVGVDVVSLLGAAGVVGVAIGFASQTTLSNLISGIFIVSERSLRLGDTVRVSGEEGVVESIKLLSITLRKYDNALVRIPCEMLIKNPVVNLTREPLRRCDLSLGVAYGTDIHRVRAVVERVAAAEPLVETQPELICRFEAFGDSALELTVGVWCRRDVYHQARFSFAAALQTALDEAGIAIPYPTRSLIVEPAQPEQKS